MALPKAEVFEKQALHDRLLRRINVSIQSAARNKTAIRVIQRAENFSKAFSAEEQLAIEATEAGQEKIINNLLDLRDQLTVENVQMIQKDFDQLSVTIVEARKLIQDKLDVLSQ